MINSKEKLIPSHRVNSPSWLPVRRRRPPGVQERHITGEEFLARVTWARWVRKAVEGMGSPPREEPTSPRGRPIHLICCYCEE